MKVLWEDVEQFSRYIDQNMEYIRTKAEKTASCEAAAVEVGPSFFVYTVLVLLSTLCCVVLSVL